MLRPTVVTQRPILPREERSSPRIHGDRGVGDFERRSSSLLGFHSCFGPRGVRLAVFCSEGTICSLGQLLTCLQLLKASFDGRLVEPHLALVDLVEWMKLLGS